MPSSAEQFLFLHTNFSYNFSPRFLCIMCDVASTWTQLNLPSNILFFLDANVKEDTQK